MSAKPLLRRAESGCMLIACVIRTCIILLPQSVVFPLVTSQVILNGSNFRVDNITCPGDEITFSCSVNGSQTLSWSSNEYIGSNGAQLEFSSGDSIGTILTSSVDSSVFANLTNVRNSNFLQSTLHLTSNQNSTVSCLTIIAGSRQSISFTVLGQDPPGTPQNPAAVEIPSTSDKCVLLVSWNPPDNVDERTIRYIVRTSRALELPPITETSTLASFLSPCKDIEGITMNVTSTDVCGNIGGTTANFKPSIPNVVTDPSNTTTSMSTAGPVPPDPQVSNNVIPAVIGGVVSSMVAAGIITIVTSISLCWYVQQRLRRIHIKEDPTEKTPLKDEPNNIEKSTALSSLADNPEIESQVTNVAVRQPSQSY